MAFVLLLGVLSAILTCCDEHSSIHLLNLLSPALRAAGVFVGSNCHRLPCPLIPELGVDPIVL